MLKDDSWNVFEKTGSVESYMLYSQFKNEENKDGNSWSSNQGNQIR